jgi:exopolysaccharide biosynthesis protein
VGATLAINANFYARLPGAPIGWMAGQPVDLVGPSVSEGRVVSPAKRSGLGHPALLVTRNRQARIKCALARDLAGQDDVVAGVNHPPTRGCLLLDNGRNDGDKASASLRARHPRTAVGLTRDRRELILVVVDGRQPGWSVGMTLAELGALMRRLGAHTAVNLDGGGSSSFLYRPARGAEVTNRPSDGGWRPVANQLAVVLRAP